MTYEIKFIPSALKEWNKLDNSIKQSFKKALEKRAQNPFIISSKLRDQPIDCYKIKLRSAGYRLVYTVEKAELVVMVLTINRRDIVYEKLNERIKDIKN